MVMAGAGVVPFGGRKPRNFSWAFPLAGLRQFHASKSPVLRDPGRRRKELEESGHQFLAAFRCEPIPEGAGDFYATVKLARQQHGLTLDENDLWVAATALALGATLVSRDGDFGRIICGRSGSARWLDGCRNRAA